jgi:hypothetical protein
VSPIHCGIQSLSTIDWLYKYNSVACQFLYPEHVAVIGFTIFECTFSGDKENVDIAVSGSRFIYSRQERFAMSSVVASNSRN